MLYRNIKTIDNLEAADNAKSFTAIEAQLAGTSDIIN
jgi:hypothetical protein